MTAHPVWRLDVITRCAPLQSLLSRDDHAQLATALFSASDDAFSAAADAYATTAPTANAAAATNASSSHLERWKQWKLDAAHIERLTSAHGLPARSDSDEPVPQAAQDNEPLHFLSAMIADLRFFARGKRGVLYAGELTSTGAGVVVKLAAASSDASITVSASASVTAEARWLRVMNRMGIGAALVARGDGWFVCERLDGANVVDFLSSSGTTSANARWVLREMLCQCFAMDLMGVNKEEMTHPHRHIIIHTAAPDKSPVKWKCSFVDFEKCAFTKKPKNVTQLCQFLSSPRMIALFGAKGIAFDVLRLRMATKQYKQKSASPQTFGDIMRVFGL
uniref:Protein kinase domain-containing protein n=1 Tax=Globisporangium ultimum (strain ATCC 200006 / CBS 805.95 / DAOM BR144) TaxID=431595 RepID=K3X2H0_GLOUD